ncbi:MAG TPA: carboxypeptidase regulatory-like domain-containing protein [Longimicrobiales bacterium]|nr:carboxypeptidase regulatory-like domain-containing protein [Longimicrobiales bacterium]
MNRDTRIPTVFLIAAAVALVATPLASQTPEHEGEIEGVVRAADTGAPLAGSTVSVVGVRQRATTHADGSFHLTGIAPGSYTVSVGRLGYRGASANVVIGEESAYVVLELEPSPLQIAGLVITGSLTERSAPPDAPPGERDGR